MASAAATSARQDAKHERALKALLKLPDNRRCAVCDTLGPQYVVTDYNIFVCAVCSGVHRQFNHRCKGVTMATFKPEEIQAIEDGGNAVAMGTFLARWSPDDLPKPVDRSPTKIRDWIEAVFVRKRFYAEPQFRSLDGGGGGGASASASGRTSHPASPALASPERGHLAAPAAATAGLAAEAAAAPRADSGGLISLDEVVGTVQSALPAAAAGWDAFGDAAAPDPAPAAAPVDGWAAFGAPEAAASPPPPAAAAADAPAGWASFDALTPAPLPPASPPRAAATAGVSTMPSPSTATTAEPGGWAAFDTPAPALAPAPAPAPSASTTPSRAQLPSDLFSARPASAGVPSAPPSLAPSSTSASPAQPVASGQAAVPPASDPFSTLMPGLRGALPNGHGPTAAASPPLPPPGAGGMTTPTKASGNPFA